MHIILQSLFRFFSKFENENENENGALGVSIVNQTDLGIHWFLQALNSDDL